VLGGKWEYLCVVSSLHGGDTYPLFVTGGNSGELLVLDPGAWERELYGGDRSLGGARLKL
jgi:hypothetical protein